MKISKAYIRKNKKALASGRSKHPGKDWIEPIYQGNITIDRKEYHVDAWPATNKWGVTDLYVEISKKNPVLTDEEFYL